MSTIKSFTNEEIEIILQAAQMNNGQLNAAVTRELANLTNRTTGSIRAWYYRYEQNRHRQKDYNNIPHRQTLIPKIPNNNCIKQIQQTKQIKQEKELSEILKDVIHQLTVLTEVVRRVAEEVAVQDKWIKDTIFIKNRQFTFTVDEKGFIQSMKYNDTERSENI